MQRLATRVIVLLAGFVLLAACGGAPASAPSTPSSGGGAFPVTIEHTLGSTTIPSMPQRVVSLGYTDQDAILAFDVVPVGIREFTGKRPSATWPWAAPALKGQQPMVFDTQEIDPETVAALRPDLIVAVSAELTPDQYATFSRIAPTITRPVGSKAYQVKWQDATRIIAKALGQSPRAEELISALEAKYAAVRAQFPQFAGKSAAVAAASSAGSGGYFVWTSADNRGQFLKDVGLTVPSTFDQLAGANFYADISAERLNLLDEADVVAWLVIPGTPNGDLDKQPGAPALKVAQAGRVLNLTEEQAVALSFSSVLSLPGLLDQLPGELAAKLGG